MLSNTSKLGVKSISLNAKNVKLAQTCQEKKVQFVMDVML